MKVKGLTLAETIIGLSLISLIALGTSTAFSSAGNILRRSDDIKELSETSTNDIVKNYNNTTLSDDKCTLQINDNITLSGSIYKSSSHIAEFEGYYMIRPLPQRSVEDETVQEES